ncbi:hypothetical protein [Methylobacter sp.]|uniref:hypothetical protein n=1 Tax=Methylobacter sp. TaxID=2051955 RepID=UPI002FDEAFC2
MLFKDFEFDILKSNDFKEDSVREELITPILHRLGYKSHGDYKIQRGKALNHPYVLIGTQKQKINIFPDYILSVKKNVACVLDAKSPKENIRNGKNVEQAYSYAIHPDVRASLYALCNGNELTVFHINQINPILIIPLIKSDELWGEIENVLAPYKIQDFSPMPQNLYPDYGTMLYKAGIKSHVIQYDYDVPVDHIVRVNDHTFSINLNRMVGDIEYAVAYDFDAGKLSALLKTLPENKAFNIVELLTRQPYKANIQPPHKINITSIIGEPTETMHEIIIPLIVREFNIAQ